MSGGSPPPPPPDPEGPMKTTTIGLAPQVRGDGGNVTIALPSFLNGASPYDIQDYALLENSQYQVTAPTVPTGAAIGMAIIVPPPGSTVDILLQGQSGDAGLDLGSCYPWAAIPLPADTTGFYLLAADPVVVRIYWL
jgi:hypothetical protein